MCGIAGIINFNQAEEKQDLLGRMIGMIRHRGPDSAGIYLNGPAGLGHARLSIIDLQTGDQPIHNEDRTVWVIFNGEIFNYPELRKDLIDRGHHFYTHSDTEILVHLYEEDGPEMFSKLNGQFAIALWDKTKQGLLLARDRVGIRPLFYHHEQGRLVFGSEIKAVFADETIPRKLDPQTIADIFTCWTPIGVSTPFQGIFQVRPGHYALFSKNGFLEKSYWHLPYSSLEPKSRPLEEWVDELNVLVKDATRIRLRADVPVGAYLSGGIDSTYISSLVRNFFNNRLSTFSVSFADERFNECSYQEIAVNALQTKHHVINCQDEDIGNIFPRVIWHTETPIIRTAPAPLYLLSGLVRKNDFKVVLTGEGADEIFAGYNIFKEDKVRRFWARNPDSKIRFRLLEKLYPYIFTKENEKAGKFLTGFFKKGLHQTDSPVYSHILRWQNTSQTKTFFHPDFIAGTGDLEQFVSRFASTLPHDFMNWKPLSRAQFIENTVFMSNYLLSSQGDRMAMANSIEGRYPFLDYRVIEFACRVPVKFRMNGLEEKYILKKAAKGLIPEALIKRVKQPYRAPISSCFFRKPSPAYVSTMLSEHAIQKNGYFDEKKVAGLVKKSSGQNGMLLSERENMALAGILSTQLLDHLFISNFSQQAPYPNEDMVIFTD
ncbi:MAG: asparagine synthase (glutamine-hydrolyzing) [Desulfobacteraceae bacterium]|nr:MAG: asparagine synthase (glutamine-hydrolyzing) [Desulfobacteraceae bacterium]